MLLDLKYIAAWTSYYYNRLAEVAIIVGIHEFASGYHEQASVA